MIHLPMPMLTPVSTLANIIAPIAIGIGIVTVLRHRHDTDTNTLLMELVKTIGLIAIPLLLSYAVGYPGMVVLFGLYQLDRGYIRQLNLAQQPPLPPLSEQATECVVLFEVLKSPERLHAYITQRLDAIQDPIEKFHTALRLGNMIPCNRDLVATNCMILSTAFKTLFNIPDMNGSGGSESKPMEAVSKAMGKSLRTNPSPISGLLAEDVLALAILCTKYSTSCGIHMKNYMCAYIKEHGNELPIDQLQTIAQMYHSMNSTVRSCFILLEKELDTILNQKDAQTINFSVESERLQLAHMCGLITKDRRGILALLVPSSWSDPTFSPTSLEMAPRLVAAGYLTHLDSYNPASSQVDSLGSKLDNTKIQERHQLIFQFVNTKVGECRSNLQELNTTVTEILKLMYEYTLIEKINLQSNVTARRLFPKTTEYATLLCSLLTESNTESLPIDTLLSWYSLSHLLAIDDLENEGAKNQIQGTLHKLITAALDKQLQLARAGNSHTAAEIVEKTVKATLPAGDHAFAQTMIKRYNENLPLMEETALRREKATSEGQRQCRQGGFVVTITGIFWGALRLASMLA